MPYWKPVAILIAVLLLLVVAALSGYQPGEAGIFDRNKQSSEGKPKFVNLGEFLINLNGDDGKQYLKTSIALKLDKSGKTTEVEASIPEIRHHVNMVLQSLTADELATNEGKLKLAETIKEHAEYVTGFRKTLPAEGGVKVPIKASDISDVLFTSFIIQR